jgi:hypothetical protein
MLEFSRFAEYLFVRQARTFKVEGVSCPYPQMLNKPKRNFLQTKHKKPE